MLGLNNKILAKINFKIVLSRILCLIFWVGQVNAIRTSDFIPNFLKPSMKESKDVAAPVKPLVDPKRDSNSKWYCNRAEEGTNNVFCDDEETKQKMFESIIYDNRKSDKTNVVDITTSAAKPTANQSALQDQKTREALDSQRNDLAVPIKTGKDVDISVGQKQVEIKFKY